MKPQEQLFSVMHRLWQSDLSNTIEDYIHCWKAIMEIKGFVFKRWEDLNENELEICLERFGQDVERMFAEYINTEHHYSNLEAFVKECDKFIEPVFTQKKILEYYLNNFKTTLGNTFLYSTADGRVFTRFTQAQKHTRGELSSDTKPLFNKDISHWTITINEN